MAHHDDAMDVHDDGQEEEQEEEEAMFDDEEAEEIVEENQDAAMDSGDEDDGEDQQMLEIQLQNDSAAHFDKHTDSIFCIAQHPVQNEIVATGGGDDVAYIWNITPPDGPLLPTSYESNPQPKEREGQEILAKLDGQDESVNAICFTLPKGDFVVTGTLAGKLSAYTVPTSSRESARLVGSAKEVQEINWIFPCPHPDYPNTIAFGANDGSVWVYSISASDPASSLTIVQSYYLHQGACTAGAWTPDGKLLATVSEDSTLFVWDVFGEAAAAGITNAASGQAIIALSGADERFRVDGGLYSVAISPGGGILAVGGADGNIRVVGLPRLSSPAAGSATGAKGAGAKGKAGGSKQAATKGAVAGQSGQILASLQAQGDGVETLDFSQPPLTLLAAGSVDGSVVLFDVAHNFAVRRHIREAHEEEAVIKVEFAKEKERAWLLTTCGNDGVVRQWDVRGGTAAAARGLFSEWRGHRGGGEGGGILGFVQGRDGKRVATAGDDSVALVFDTA